MNTVMIERRGRRRMLLSTVVLLGLGMSGVASPALAAPSVAEPTVAVIVQLTPGSDSAGESRGASGRRGAVDHVYSTAVDGFAGAFTQREIATLRNNPRVALIEPDAVATILDTQAGATWGLDRIDQRARPLNTTYNYPTAAGAGVTAYVIDTGIVANAEFGTRLGAGYADPAFSGVTSDCNGHGTHVAGTLAGGTYGVAKLATLVPVRVLNCAGSGSYSGVIAGLDWAATNHVAGVPAVANLSLGGPSSTILDQAVQRLIADGVTVSVAAGNSNADACKSSPSRVPAALTVGATDSSDVRAYFSNFGSCLDLFAPGVAITSVTTLTPTASWSGTSMAAPHVAGAAAVLLSRAGNATLTPAQVAAQLVSASTKNVVVSPGRNSLNRLLYAAP